jgi:predicted HD superfamily hydrolase involved in NAD metabolism
VQRFYRDAGRLDTLTHVTQVAAEARVLATRYDADREATLLAALAHDLAAVVPESGMIAVAEGMGLPLDEADRDIPQLLHGPIAAAALAEKLDIRDRDLLNAVRYHSTLRAGASTLEKIVFVADKMAYDPTSSHRGEYVPALRAACLLDEAALVYLRFLRDYAPQHGWLVHPNAVAAYRELTGRTTS